LVSSRKLRSRTEKEVSSYKLGETKGKLPLSILTEQRIKLQNQHNSKITICRNQSENQMVVHVKGMAHEVSPVVIICEVPHFMKHQGRVCT
jgi:hypothetical protein